MRKSSLVVLITSLIVLSTVVVYSADAAGIPKKAISLASRFIENDLPTTTVFTDTANTFNAGSKQTFQGSTSGTSGIRLAGISGNPSSLTTGDLWFNTAANVNAFKFYDVNSATQTIVSTTATCGNNQVLQYRTSNGTWGCSSFLSSAVTKINDDATALQYFNQVSGNTTITDQGTGQHQIDIGPNVVTTIGNNGRQVFKKGLDFGASQTDYFGNAGMIIRNPTNTFATTLQGGAISTANRTLNLPAITGTDTLGSLGMTQSWTGANTFSGQVKTITGASGLTLQDPTTTSKQVQFDNSGASASTTLTIKDQQTTSQTLQVPNISGTDTLATLGLSQTWGSGAKQTLQSSSTTAGLNVAGVSSNPSSLSAGDLWRHTGIDSLMYRGTSSTYVLKTNRTIALSLAPSNQTMGGSNSIQMAGLGVAAANPTTFTPAVTGRVLVTISFDPISGTNNVPYRFWVAYGTGTGPSNGPGKTGTVVGSGFFATPPFNGAAYGISVTHSVVISGLTPGTTYWLDLQVNDGNKAITLADTQVTIIEI